jgi:hypothetical protein
LYILWELVLIASILSLNNEQNWEKYVYYTMFLKENLC